MQNQNNQHQQLDLERIVASLLFRDQISLTTYKIEPEMFVNKDIKYYIQTISNLKGKLSTADSNQKYLSKSRYGDSLFFDVNYISYIQSVYAADTIMDMFYKNVLQRKAQEKLQNAHNYTASQSSARDLELIFNDLTELSASLDVQAMNEVSDIFENYKAHYAKTAETANNELLNGQPSIIGIPSGIDSLDFITKGFKPSEYVILAGRPSMGKTSAALDIVASALMRDKSILFLSLEMSSDQIIARLLPKLDRQLSLDNTFLAQDSLNYQDKIYNAVDFLKSKRFYIEDFSKKSSMTLTECEKTITMFSKKFKGIDLIVLDYIQMLEGEGKSFGENSQTSEISARIKRLAKKTKASWIVLSQLNRALETRNDKRPMASDLRNSGSLEQDADIILFPFRETVYLERSLKEQLLKKPDNHAIADALVALTSATIENAEIIVGKNRNGAIGTANVQFHRPSASYVPIGYFEEIKNQFLD